MLLNTILGPAGPPTLKKIAMNCKLMLPLLIGGVLVVQATGSAYAQGFGGPDQFDPGPPSETKPAPKPPRVRRMVTIKLPEQYRSRDTNKDGQIGMYEWPRSDYTTFRKLDLNHDGFLTPQELTASSSSRSPPPAITATPPGAPGPAVVATTTAAVAASPAESVDGTAAAPAPQATGSRTEAERFFELMDKDKNGKITEDEFKRSILVSKKFSDAGIAATFPLSRDEFTRLYPQPAR
jgi:EF-hand domain pair